MRRVTAGRCCDGFVAGACGLSRHPMYVGWTLAYLGAGAVSANAWAVVLSPGLVLLVEREVRREEQHLDEQFGLDYSAYRRRVPRYLPLPHRRS